MFGEVGAPGSSFGTKNHMTIRPTHFVNIK